MKRINVSCDNNENDRIDNDVNDPILKQIPSRTFFRDNKGRNKVDEY